MRFLEENAPDVLMVQELKGQEVETAPFEALGYHIEAVGQKAYNGVAMISKHPVNVIMTALPGDELDEQARYIEADINGLRLINIYAPNGNPVGTEKFTYKLSWMERLHERLSVLRAEGVPFAIGGDFNIIPEPRDCHDPKAWADDALYRPESKKMLRRLINSGLYDAFRILNKQAEQYTFWDYQASAWQKNNGIRIDHFLLSPLLVDHLKNCAIDKTPRGWEKPSDHTPIYIELDEL